MDIGYRPEDVKRVIGILHKRGMIEIQPEEILDYLEPQRGNLFYHEFYSQDRNSKM